MPGLYSSMQVWRLPVVSGRMPPFKPIRRVADALDVTNDYLPKGAAGEAVGARSEDRGLLKRFQAIERLPI